PGAPIRRILLTHAHVDHVGSLDALVSQSPRVEFAIGQRESRLLRKDFSLDPGEAGKRLVGFPGVKSQPTLLLNDGDRVGSLQAIFSPGHTPGHFAFLDVRDGSLIAGDERAVPDIQKGKVARRMTRREYRLKGSDAVAVIQEQCRLRLHARKTNEPFARFTRIERKVLPQESGLALPNCKFHAWRLRNQRVQGPHVINVSVREKDAADWRAR